MQIGISPPETHKPRLKMSSSRSRDDIRRRVRTHDPLLLLPTSPAANGSSSLWMHPAPQVFRYTGRQSFGEVYTLCFKGGDKWRCPGAVAPRWERIVLHARWPAHGRPHSYRFHPTDNRGGLTGSAWKSGDINQPNVDRWTSEETITRWVTIPEGLIVLREVKEHHGGRCGTGGLRRNRIKGRESWSCCLCETA